MLLGNSKTAFFMIGKAAQRRFQTAVEKIFMFELICLNKAASRVQERLKRRPEVGDSAVSGHSISLLIDHPKLYAERRHAVLFTGRLKLAV
jgi:hypothetical protein